MGSNLNSEVMDILESVGAMKEGHFLLSSGLHSPVYWEKFRLLQYPVHAEKLCRLIVQHFKDQSVDVVAGPTTGGIILAFEIGRQLGIRSIFVEEEGEARVLRRDFEFKAGERVLIVDDVLTTGGSIKGTIDAVNKLGGVVIGIGVLVDRSTEEIDFNVPLFSCLRVPAVVYPAEACPLCAAGRPLVRPGGRLA